MMIVGRLVSRVDPRILITFGQTLVAWSLYDMAQFTLDVPQSMIVSTGLLQGFGMGFVFVPLSTIAYSTLAPKFRGDATSVFSLVRNIGSSIGISVMVAVLAQNTQINHAELSAHLTPFSNAVRMAEIAQARVGMTEGSAAAMEMLNNQVTAQAATISYLNDFRLIMYIVLASLPLVFLLRAPQRKAASKDEAAMHAVME
jgi:DHA2 family multidrug resistance protein